MKIAIGCDHGGIALKPAIVEELKRRGIDIVDVGCYDTSSVDYPDYGAAVARKVASGECDKGILMCGTGIGVIALGGRIVSPEQAAKMVGIWLDTPFGGGRHAGRVAKISAIEEENFK